MTWRDRLARVWVAIALAIGGCMARSPTLSALPSGPVPLPPAPTVAARTAVAEERPDVTRSQKPDVAGAHTTSAVCLISQPVEKPAEASNANPTATIRAVVNGDPILEEEVRMSCYQQLAGARSPKERQEILKQALEVLIDREVLLQDALAKLERGGPQGAKFIQQLRKIADEEFEKRWLKPLMDHNHIENREEFAAFMQQGGMSLDVMKRWWERNFMAMEYLRSRIEPHLSHVGHTEIADYYTSHREEYTQPDSVHWQDILINEAPHASRAAAREFAESLLRRVRQGEDFVKLSAEFDNGTSGRFRKGDGEGRIRGKVFPPEAEEVLFRMHDGDIEIVECKTGFHVVRLVKREYAGPIPFDSKVQKEIRDKLRNSVFQSEMKSIVTELKRKAIIDPPVR
ncbi:MAG TPA: peptidyl-prolyl cis-trans isomerase [Gemmataceae bacterium]|nr:peptidyl-prolyl cis-trans isomerase [Gemmataceae bacterium]